MESQRTAPTSAPTPASARAPPDDADSRSVATAASATSHPPPPQHQQQQQSQQLSQQSQQLLDPQTLSVPEQQPPEGSAPPIPQDSRPVATFTLNDLHVHLPPYIEDVDEEFHDHSSAFLTGILDVSLPILPPPSGPNVWPPPDGSATFKRGGLKRAGAASGHAGLRPSGVSIHVEGSTDPGEVFFSSFTDTLWELKPETKTKRGPGSVVGGDVEPLDTDRIAANLDVFENNLLFVKAVDSGLTSISFPFRIEIPAIIPSTINEDRQSKPSRGPTGDNGDEEERQFRLRSWERNYKAPLEYPFPSYEIQCVISFYDPAISTSVATPAARTVVSKVIEVRRTVPDSWIAANLVTRSAGVASNGFQFEVYHPLVFPLPQKSKLSSQLSVRLKIASSRANELFRVSAVDFKPVIKFYEIATKQRKEEHSQPIGPTFQVKASEVLKSVHFLTINFPFIPRNADTTTEHWRLEHWIEGTVHYKERGNIVNRKAKFGFPVEVVHPWPDDSACDADLKDVFREMPIPKRYLSQQCEVPYSFSADPTPLVDQPGDVTPATP
ncbi:hypothetical protein HK405_008841, partial [Cladochytrium tenue]